MSQVTIEIIESPAELSAARATELAVAFEEVSSRATGGPSWETYQPAREGWRQFFATPGTRPQDYHRIALAWAGRELFHLTGIHVVELGGGDTLIWVHVTMSREDARGRDLTRVAMRQVLEDWLRTLAGRRIWLVYRTLNPVVYELGRQFFRRYLPKGVRAAVQYPEIREDGTLEPRPPEVTALAERACRRLTPERPFDPKTWVIEGLFNLMGPVSVFANLNFPSDSPGPKRYFDAHLDRQRQDAILCLVEFDLER